MAAKKMVNNHRILVLGLFLPDAVCYSRVDVRYRLQMDVRHYIQESLAKAKVSARQQCVYEDQFCHLTVV